MARLLVPFAWLRCGVTFFEPLLENLHHAKPPSIPAVRRPGWDRVAGGRLPISTSSGLAAKPVRFGLITDLHHRQFDRDESVRLEAFSKAVEASSPDFVIQCGDFTQFKRPEPIVTLDPKGSITVEGRTSRYEDTTPDAVRAAIPARISPRLIGF